MAMVRRCQQCGQVMPTCSIGFMGLLYTRGGTL